MDWLRRIIGMPDRSQQDVNPFKNPTWEEIMEQRNQSDRMPPSNGPFSGTFHNEDSWIHPKEFEGSFSSIFGQMDDMFSQLDMMMKDFHSHPGQLIITEQPDNEDPSERKSPRDFLLKKPDSEASEDSKNQPLEITPYRPYSPYFGPIHPYSGPADDDHEENDGYHDESHSFSGGIRIFDPHGMIDDFFKNFSGWSLQEIPHFGEIPDSHLIPGLGMNSDEHSRDSLMKKEDTDLDDRISGGLSQLLKEGPSYSYDAPQGSSDSRHPNIIQPQIDQTQPRAKQGYRSTSIVRIRRPDGTIEETKRYTDSTGREEVTVTHSQPDSTNESGPPHQPGTLEGPTNSDSYWPSVFSKIFIR